MAVRPRREPVRRRDDGGAAGGPARLPFCVGLARTRRRGRRRAVRAAPAVPVLAARGRGRVRRVAERAAERVGGPACGGGGSRVRAVRHPQPELQHARQRTVHCRLSAGVPLTRAAVEQRVACRRRPVSWVRCLRLPVARRRRRHRVCSAARPRAAAVAARDPGVRTAVARRLRRRDGRRRRERRCARRRRGVPAIVEVPRPFDERWQARRRLPPPVGDPSLLVPAPACARAAARRLAIPPAARRDASPCPPGPLPAGRRRPGARLVHVVARVRGPLRRARPAVAPARLAAGRCPSPVRSRVGAGAPGRARDRDGRATTAASTSASGSCRRSS